MHNAHSDSSVGVLRRVRPVRSCKNCGLFPPLFTEVPRIGILGSSELPWCSGVLCATAHIQPPQSRVCCLRYVTGRGSDTFLPSPLYKRGGLFMRRTILLLATMALT